MSSWTTSFLECRVCTETPEEALTVPIKVVGLHHVISLTTLCEICFLHSIMTILFHVQFVAREVMKQKEVLEGECLAF